MDEREILAPAELAAMRADVERDGLQSDPLVGEHAERRYCGLNLAVAWPLPGLAAYDDLARRVEALDPGLYVYPYATTHVTVLTAVNFKLHPDASPEVVGVVEQAAESLGGFLAETMRRVSPFELEIGRPALARAAAFLPMLDRSGEIAKLRERALIFCRETGGILAHATAPRAVHSTFVRFRERPRDAVAFARAFDEVTRDVRLDPLRIERVLVTTESKPYMRAGRVSRDIPCG